LLLSDRCNGTGTNTLRASMGEAHLTRARTGFRAASVDAEASHFSAHCWGRFAPLEQDQANRPGSLSTFPTGEQPGA
jgi:hypothetical protein